MGHDGVERLKETGRRGEHQTGSTTAMARGLNWTSSEATRAFCTIPNRFRDRRPGDDDLAIANWWRKTSFPFRPVQLRALGRFQERGVVAAGLGKACFASSPQPRTVRTDAVGDP